MILREQLDTVLLLVILVSVTTNIVLDATRHWLQTRRWRKAMEDHRACFTVVHNCKRKPKQDKSFFTRGREGDNEQNLS